MWLDKCSLLGMTFWDQSALCTLFVIWGICYYGKKIAGSNNAVSSAVKDAATKKAVGFIGRLFK